MRKLAFTLIAILVFSLCSYADLTIMTWNIKDFWLKFDGESGEITQEGGKLDDKDLVPLNIISSIILAKEPDVIAIQECASLGELLYFNREFLNDRYLCWSFRYADSRTFGIPLGLMVRKELQVDSIELYEPKTFSSRGIVIAEISKDNYEFVLISVHLKSKIESEDQPEGYSATKRHEQVVKIREKVKEMLEEDSGANIIVCGDFNDAPGIDNQETAAQVDDLIEEMRTKIEIEDEEEVKIKCATLEDKDKDENGELWSEESSHGKILFDYFFLTEGVWDKFKDIDHIYPEEFVNIKKGSDHIPVIIKINID